MIERVISPYGAASALLVVTILLLWGGALFQAARFDELYHVLAARGWLETGTYRINTEGVYTRGAPVTWTVAQLFSIFGDHLAAARLVGFFPAVSLVVVGGWWLSRQTDRLTGFAWMVICGFSPFLIEVASFVRWYGLLVLLTGLFFAGLIEMLLPAASAKRRLAGACLVAAASILIIPFQMEILAPLGGMAILMVARASILSWRIRVSPYLVIMVLFIAALILAIAISNDIMEKFWRMYRYTALWSAESANAPLFYHRYFLIYYPTLWPITGLLWLAGRRIAPLLADCAVIIAGVGLIFHSGAGLKATRYIAYLVPWLYLVWALGLVGSWRYIQQLRIAWPNHWAPRVVIAGALAFAILGNAAFVRAITMAVGVTVPPELPSADWTAAAEILRPEAEQADIVISTSELEAIYALGRVDYAINQSLYVEVLGKDPIAFDRRSGVRVVRDLPALKELLGCGKSALIVSDIYRWQDPSKAQGDVTAYIEQTTKELLLPTETKIRSWYLIKEKSKLDCKWYSNSPGDDYPNRPKPVP